MIIKSFQKANGRKLIRIRSRHTEKRLERTRINQLSQSLTEQRKWSIGTTHKKTKQQRPIKL